MDMRDVKAFSKQILELLACMTADEVVALAREVSSRAKADNGGSRQALVELSNALVAQVRKDHPAIKPRTQFVQPTGINSREGFGKL